MCSPWRKGDDVPPETAIDSATDGTGAALANGDSTRSASIEISFSGTGNLEVACFQCSLDGAGFTACTSPFSASGLSLGSHLPGAGDRHRRQPRPHACQLHLEGQSFQLRPFRS
jgi:hypothetical protein